MDKTSLHNIDTVQSSTKTQCCPETLGIDEKNVQMGRRQL